MKELNKADRLKMLVDLHLKKLEITLLRYKDQGYEWSMLGKDGQREIEFIKEEIDKTIIELKHFTKGRRYQTFK